MSRLLSPLSYGPGSSEVGMRLNSAPQRAMYTDDGADATLRRLHGRSVGRARCSVEVGCHERSHPCVLPHGSPVRHELCREPRMGRPILLTRSALFVSVGLGFALTGSVAWGGEGFRAADRGPRRDRPGARGALGPPLVEPDELVELPCFSRDGRGQRALRLAPSNARCLARPEGRPRSGEG